MIGKPLTLNGQGYTVVGVIPAGFPFFGAADVFTLLGQWDDVLARSRETASRAARRRTPEARAHA